MKLSIYLFVHVIYVVFGKSQLGFPPSPPHICTLLYCNTYASKRKLHDLYSGLSHMFQQVWQWTRCKFGVMFLTNTVCRHISADRRQNANTGNYNTVKRDEWLVWLPVQARSCTLRLKQTEKISKVQVFILDNNLSLCFSLKPAQHRKTKYGVGAN